MMKTTTILLTLLLSANAFASNEAPDWWNDSTCRKERNDEYASLKQRGFSSKEATARSDEDFKRCICSNSDESKKAVDALLDSGFEIEMILPNPTRVISIPIEFARDFSINSFKNECFLKVERNELCENSGFLNAAKQSFRVFQTYDEKSKNCKIDLDNQFFK